MERFVFKDFSQLRDSIIEELRREGRKRALTRGEKKQFVKDFINQNIDSKILIKISRNNASLNQNPPHIIPFNFNKVYIIKYNLIELLSEEKIS